MLCLGSLFFADSYKIKTSPKVAEEQFVMGFCMDVLII